MNKTGLKLNVLSGLVSSFWSGAASIVVVPFYFAILGPANFGLVVFSTTLLGLFVVLDLGFATSINREVAQADARGDTGELRDLLHSLATVYWLVAMTAGAGTFLSAPSIARTFLTSVSVDPATVVDAVRIMAVMVTLRLPSGLYMGVILGSQRIVAANIATLIVTTLSTFGAFAALRITGGGILTFLVWQAIISAFNVALLGGMAWKALPGQRRARISALQLRRIWRFSAVIALTTVIGALILQLDKLVLARFSQLDIVGEYGLAGFASRALLLLVGPVFAALYPRLTELHARGEIAALIEFYRVATRALTCVLAAASIFFLLNARDVLALWTGSSAVAAKLEQVAPMLLIGTALNGLMYVPHAVQLAYGNARIAFWNNLAMFAFLAPAVFLLVPPYGMIGAATGWLGANMINVLAGTWLTHRELLPGLATRWLAIDVALSIIATCVLPIVGTVALSPASSALARVAIGAVLSSAGLVLGLCSTATVRAAMLPRRWGQDAGRAGGVGQVSFSDR